LTDTHHPSERARECKAGEREEGERAIAIALIGEEK